jgi:hypoxanthine phosphoribosyltransferase
MSDRPKTLIAEPDIQQRVTELAAQISRDYAGKDSVTLLAVLKGAFIFLADLARRLTIPHRIEFIALSSYEKGAVSSGVVRLEMDVRDSIEGNHVIIVEDIVDTGHTLHHLIDLLSTRNPASVRTCALVRKKDRHEVEVAVSTTPSATAPCPTSALWSRARSTRRHDGTGGPRLDALRSAAVQPPFHPPVAPRRQLLGVGARAA